MRHKILSAVLFSFIFLGLPYLSFAAIKCVNAEGESLIVNNDIPSAKTEAIARAKWSAIEQTVGVEVKAQSIVQNFAIVDDAISKNIRGTVQSFKVILEDNRKDTFWVKINACVEPNKAQDALMSLALNNSVAVFIPARKPKVISEYDTKHSSYIHTKDEYEETNILSEKLIGKLIEQGYQVVDVAPTHAMDAKDIESSLKSGNYMTLRSLMYKFLSNVLLIGKIDYTISTKKGEDVGYGISMPFHSVTVRLTYRVITRDKAGKNQILSAGAEEARGLATNVKDATEKGIQALEEKVTPMILDVMANHIKGASKKVTLIVKGVSDLNTHLAVKDILQHLAWVTNVEEKTKTVIKTEKTSENIMISELMTVPVGGLGEFVVSYPENTIYLANSISQKGNFQIVNFSPYSITLRYNK